MREIKFDIKPKIRRLELFTRKGISGALTGAYRTSFRGKGLEFSDFRRYTSYDDANLIDWKTSLKAQELMIKEYEEERNINIVFLVDVSSTMSFTSTEKLKNEYVAEIVSSLSFALLQAGDNAGLVMFSDKINYHLLPSGGNRQYYQILQGLSDPKNYEGKKNFKRGIDFLMTYLKDRSVVVIISDFIGVEEDWQQSLATALAKFEIIAMMVRDPRDDTMPEGAGHVVLSDPFSKAQKVIDPLYIGQKYATIAKSQKSEILREFAKIDADIIELRTDKDYLHPILKLFKKREKRMR